MELLQYWKIIQRSLWIILLICAVGTGFATYNSQNQPDIFESSSTILLNPSVPSSLLPYVRTEAAAGLAASYSELMKTRYFGEAVAKELPFRMLADQVTGSISTNLVPNTLFFRISGRADSPEKAQQLVSATIKVFLAENQSQQNPSGEAAGTSKQVMRQTLEDKLGYFRGQIDGLLKQITALEAQPLSKERGEELSRLRGELVQFQEAETNTMVALNQLGSDSGAEAQTALVLDAPLPGRPVPRNLGRDVGLALAVSVLIGVGLAFFRDYLDRSVRLPEHVEQVLGVAPAATIAAVGGSPISSPLDALNKNRVANTNLSGRKLVVLEAPRSREAESFRMLRTNIQFSHTEKPIRSLVVTSVAPREGKTFVAANLALVMAQAGKRVILVDADLRRPSLHEMFDLPNDLGFANLVGQTSARLAEATKHLPGIVNLAVVTSGPVPPDPSGLLNTQHVSLLMTQLAEQADIVIYDTPPSGGITDTAILAARVDAVVLVIAAGVPRADEVARVAQGLENVGASVVLPVLNKLKSGDIYDYSSYYYHHENKHEASSSTNGSRTSTDAKVVVTQASRGANNGSGSESHK